MPETTVIPEINHKKEHPLGYMIGGFVLGCVATASLLLPPKFESDKTTADPTPELSTNPPANVPGDCPRAAIEDDPKNTVEFAVDTTMLATYTEQLQAATSFEQAEVILNTVFAKWNYSVHIAQIPTLAQEQLETRGHAIEHEPELITQSLVNASAVHIVESLSRIPEPILAMTQGTQMFLTMGMVGESGNYAGLYSKDSEDKPVIIVGVGPHDPSGEIFEHELIHNLFFRLCGDNIGYNDTELALLNPPNWSYTRKTLPFDTWSTVTASEYGATNTTEDIAEAFPQLFNIQLTELCLMNDAFLDKGSPICKKLNLLLERIAAVSPETATYLRG